MTIPDWKKASDYEFITIEEIKREGVAWEFLRRNENYINDYNNVKKGKFTDENDKPPVKRQFGNYGGHEQKGFPYPEMKDGETEQNWFFRTLYESYRLPIFLTPSRYVAKRWGLSWRREHYLPDPTKDAKALGGPPRFDEGTTPRILTDQNDWLSLKVIESVSVHDDAFEWDPSNVVVVFSVREAPNKQWERIRPTLSKMHSQLSTDETVNQGTKSQKTGWVDALRAWDAYICNKNAIASGKSKLTHVERGNMIWPGQLGNMGKRYKAALDRAKELVDGKYRVIVRNN